MKKKPFLPPPNVGKTIQRLRQAYKLSLGDLAEQSGVSKSIISQIERNESNPTISTVWRLSNALETNIEDVLFSDVARHQSEKLTKNATPSIKSEDGLCALNVLSPLPTVQWLQWYEFRAAPGGVLESEGHQAGSTEHTTLIQGELDITFDKQKHHISAGETLRYRCDQEHVLHNNGTESAIAFMVLLLKPADFNQ